MGDMVGPLKQLIPDYKAIEKRIEAAIFAKFALALPMDPSVKHADFRLLHTEKRDNTAGAGHAWNGLEQYPALDERIVPLPPIDAKALWLDRYFELTAGRAA